MTGKNFIPNHWRTDWKSQSTNLLRIGILIPPLFATCYFASAQAVKMEEMLDVSTLDVRVLRDWHQVEGPVATRQKIINIKVGDVREGQEFRYGLSFRKIKKQKDFISRAGMVYGI